MALVAVRERLNERWTLTAACSIRRFFHRFIDFEHIITVDLWTWNRVCRTPSTYRGCVRKFIMGRHPILIIFAQKDHGEFHGSRHVHPFMEGASRPGAIAEEANCDLPILTQFRSKGCAGSNRYASPNNAISAQVAKFKIRNMHRAALTTAIPCRATKQLRHHLVHSGTLSNAVTMAPMSARDEIPVLQRRTGSGRCRLFPNIEMERPTHLGSFESLFSSFLKSTDTPHGLIDPSNLTVIHRLQCGIHRRSWTST